MTEMSMVEKVAAKILAELQRQVVDGTGTVKGSPDDLLIDGRNFDLTKIARAAVEAMREPTPEMLTAGGDGWVDEGSIWRAMIDKALEE